MASTMASREQSGDEEGSKHGPNGTVMDAPVPKSVGGVPTGQQGERPEAGLMVGPYRLESKLGAGGMGEVFRAYDRRLDRYVALKQMAAAGAGDERLRQRFRREARAAAR